jgi:hypothetical protein
MATSSIPELMTKTVNCSDCGQKLHRAMAYEGAPSNTKGELFWCANRECPGFGLMLDIHAIVKSEGATIFPAPLPKPVPH